MEAASYGGLFSTTATTEGIIGSTITLLTNLNGHRPASNVIYGVDSITVEHTGVYLVSYAVSYTFDAVSDIQFYVGVNGGLLSGTLAENHNAAGAGVQSVGRSALVGLVAGDVLRLVVLSVTASGVLGLPPFGTELNVVQIA